VRQGGVGLRSWLDNANSTGPPNENGNSSEKVIARWEDGQYSLNLFRSSMSDTFAVVRFEKRLHSQAGVSIPESIKLEWQEAPQKEAARVKKEADDLEGERHRNIEVLRP